MSRHGVTLLDPDPGDPRLAGVGAEPQAWSEGDVLTIAVRRPGEAPPALMGTVNVTLRAVAPNLWAIALRVRGLQRACLQYRLTPGEGELPLHGGALHVWRGTRAGPPAPLSAVSRAPPARRHVIDDSPIARRHPVWLWSPPDHEPRGLVLCADGAGLPHYAPVVEAAIDDGRLPPLALVGIDSDGRRMNPSEAYDATADPRARAYLHDVDPPAFDEHPRYALGRVLPWAQERLGQRPERERRVIFGCSNGAAWAAALAALHPQAFGAALVFSLGVRPLQAPRGRDAPRHALVAGRLEPGFDGETRRYALALRRRQVPVRLRRPLRGHDSGMWVDELWGRLRGRSRRSSRAPASREPPGERSAPRPARAGGSSPRQPATPPWSETSHHEGFLTTPPWDDEPAGASSRQPATPPGQKQLTMRGF